MTMNHDVHPHSNIDKLYLSMKIGRHRKLQLHQITEEEKKDSEDDAPKLVHNEFLLKTKETKLPRER